MSIQMAPLYKFKAYKLRTPAPNTIPTEDQITPEDLAEMLSILSHEAKLGPVIVPAPGHVIVAELQGYVGVEIGSGLVAPVGLNVPAPPAGGHKGR